MAKIQIDFPDDVLKFLKENKLSGKVSIQSFVVTAVEEKMHELMELRKSVAMRFFHSEEIKKQNP